MNFEDEEELELELDFGLDIDGEFDVDTLTLDTSDDEGEELLLEGLPSEYLYVEGLVLLDQIIGKLDNDDDEDMPIYPVYASKNGVDTFVTYVELTADNILAMKRFGLDVSLKREGKKDINFDTVNQLLSIAKTLREEDRVDITIDNFADDGNQHFA